MSIIQVLNSLNLFQADDLVRMLEKNALLTEGTWEVRRGGFNLEEEKDKVCIQTLNDTFYRYFV